MDTCIVCGSTLPKGAFYQHDVCARCEDEIEMEEHYVNRHIEADCYA